MRSFRSKPVGWRGESYRHYLAAKGIRTRYFDTQAWPWGKGQQRFKKVLKSRVELEPAVIPIESQKRFKSYDFPITEEEVKQQLEEEYMPEELGKGPKKVVLADTEGLYPSRARGRAFRHGGIKIYGMPVRKGGFERGRSFPGRPGVWMSRESAEELVKEDVLPHEIAHIRLKHVERPAGTLDREKSLSGLGEEVDADIITAEWRRRRTGNPDAFRGSYLRHHPSLARLQNESKSTKEFMMHLRKLKKGLPANPERQEVLK